MSVYFSRQQIVKRNLPVLDFFKIHLVRDCLFAAVCGKFSQMKSLSTVSPYSWPTPESLWIVRTQSRYEFVTPCHFILSCRQSLFTKPHSNCKLFSDRVFPLHFRKNGKSVLNVIRKLFRIGRIGPSYLPMLKATFIPKSASFGWALLSN